MTCNHCGWVHYAVSRKEAAASVAKFNRFYRKLSKADKESFGSKPASIVAYERCFSCHNPYTDFRESRPGDCPDGSTIQPIIKGEI